MNSTEIKIPNHYIATNSKGKEQIIKLDKKVINENKILYYGYYGTNGFHEVISDGNNIRELNDEERKLLSDKKYYSLPQGFYQTHPEDNFD